MAKYGLSIWEILRISSGLGLVIALPISGGTILGFILDKKLGTSPVLTLVCLLGGIFLAIISVKRKMDEINKNIKQ